MRKAFILRTRGPPIGGSTPPPLRHRPHSRFATSGATRSTVPADRRSISQREFAVNETVKLQVRAEAFNALNHTKPGTPNRFVNTPQFGTITEAATPGPEIQLGVRVSF